MRDINKKRKSAAK